MLFRKLPRFNPKSANGLLNKMEKSIDVHSAFIENIKEGSGISITKNAEGGITIDSTATATDGDYGFKVRAVAKLDQNGDPVNPPQYTVSVLSGSAQVLGGAEKIFNDYIGDDAFQDVDEGEYIYVQYNLWDDQWQAVYAWEDEILHSLAPPVDETEAPKTLVFIIAKIGSDYINFVNQFRLGSIQAVATMVASPYSDDITGVQIP